MCDYSAGGAPFGHTHSGNGQRSCYSQDGTRAKVSKWILDHQGHRFFGEAINADDYPLVPRHAEDLALQEVNEAGNVPRNFDYQRTSVHLAAHDGERPQVWSDEDKRALCEKHVVEDMETDSAEGETAFTENWARHDQDVERRQVPVVSSVLAERYRQANANPFQVSLTTLAGQQHILTTSNPVPLENDRRGEVSANGLFSSRPPIDCPSLRARSLFTPAPLSGSGDGNFVRAIPLQANSDDLEDPRTLFTEDGGRKALKESCFKAVFFRGEVQPHQLENSLTEPEHASNYSRAEIAPASTRTTNPEQQVLPHCQEPSNCTPEVHTRTAIPFLSPMYRSDSPPGAAESRPRRAFPGGECATTVANARVESGDYNARGPSRNSSENPPADDDEFWALYQRPASAEEQVQTRGDGSCGNKKDAAPCLDVPVNGCEPSAAGRGVVHDLASNGSRSESVASSETGLSRTAQATGINEPVIRLDTLPGVVLYDPRLKPHIFRGLSVCHFDLKPAYFDSHTGTPETESEDERSREARRDAGPLNSENDAGPSVKAALKAVNSCASEETAKRANSGQAKGSYYLPPLDLGEYGQVSSQVKRRDRNAPNNRLEIDTPVSPQKRMPSREGTPYSFNYSSERKRRRSSGESSSSSLLSSDSRSPARPPLRRQLDDEFSNDVDTSSSGSGLGAEQQMYVQPFYWQGHAGQPYLSWQAAYWVPVLPAPSHFVQPAFAYLPAYQQAAPISPPQPSPPGTSTVTLPPLSDTQHAPSTFQPPGSTMPSQSQTFHQQLTSPHFPAGFPTPQVSDCLLAPAQPFQTFVSSPPLSQTSRFPGELDLHPPGTSLQPPQFDVSNPSYQSDAVKHSLPSSIISERQPGVWYPPIPRPPPPPTPLQQLSPPPKSPAPPLPDCPPPPLPPLPASPPPPLPPAPILPPPNLPPLPAPAPLSWVGAAQPIQPCQPAQSPTLASVPPFMEVWPEHIQQTQPVQQYQPLESSTLAAVPASQDAFPEHIQQAEESSCEFGGEYYESQDTNASYGDDFWQEGSEEWYQEASVYDGETENSAELWENW